MYNRNRYEDDKSNNALNTNTTAAYRIRIPTGIRLKKAGLLKLLGYKIGKLLGKGSYGKIRIAEMLTNPEVKMAVKIINRKSIPKEYIKKFLPREIKILQKVKHPNIVKVHQVIDIDEKTYIFMDLAETDLLLYMQNKCAPLPQEEARRYMSCIVKAIHYIHLNNICHRDLKCDNILLFPNQVAKLSDFGFARELIPTGIGNQIKLSKSFCGTPGYSAPEIISGTPYDPRPADVWSLGCILFIMLTGTLPYDDDSRETTTLYKQQNKFIKFSHRLNRNNGKLAKHLISRMLEPEAENRIKIENINKHSWMKLSS